MMWNLLHSRGFNLGQLIATYFDRIIKRNGVICCGGLITAVVEHLKVSTEGLQPDMGEMFLSFDGLFCMDSLLKIDSSGQCFFMQTERDHFPVPNPVLTRIDGVDNKANWKLNDAIHKRVIQSTPINGMFRKNNFPRRTPIYDPNGGEEEEEEVVPNLELSHANQEEEIEDEAPLITQHHQRDRKRTVDEFQEFVTHRLDSLHEGVTTLQNSQVVMEQNWDRRWNEQAATSQQWHNQNLQNWEKNHNWRLVQQQLLEEKRLNDESIARLERLAEEARGELQMMKANMAYMMEMMENLNARFPPR